MNGRSNNGYQPPAYDYQYRDNRIHPDSYSNSQYNPESTAVQSQFPNSNSYAHLTPNASTERFYPPGATSYSDSQTNFQNIPNNRIMSSNQYNSLDGRSPWLEKQQSGNRRSKWIVISSLLGLLGLIAIGVAVGVTVSKHKPSNDTSNGTPSSSSSNPINGSDPSQFEKNPNLHQSFYGFAYTPQGSQLPNCGATIENVAADIQVLSQLTTRIRTYGADCNQASLVLQAINVTKVNMTVWLANYVDLSDYTAYDRQTQELQSALQTYGGDSVAGITVGNEVILNWVTANGGSSTDPNGPVGNQAAALLIPNITDTRNWLSNMGLSHIKVSTAEAGSYFNTQVLEVVDEAFANDHAWFADQSVNDAAAWTYNFFETTNVALAEALSNKQMMYIAETGWPTQKDNSTDPSNGASDASVANLQIYLDTWVCQANNNGTPYFYFEFMDETWKEIPYGGVEAHWGVFDANRNLKNVTIPQC